jgi:16S rRNA (cytidine1402-2'-O)-methyltransferase
MIYQILKLLETNDVALVSDAGTPLISDPGYRLVSAARSKGTRVIPIPGASAVITALSAASLPTDKFIFLGFLSKSKAKAVKALSEIANLKTTVVLYESPHRIASCIKNIKEVFGDIDITVARELTKVYEEIITKKASEFITIYSDHEPKGEIVVLFTTKS